MAPPSETHFTLTNNTILKTDDGIFQKVDPDVAANILENIHEIRLLEKNDSPQKEKQISVDPISLRALPPVATAPKVTGLMELPPALLLAKPKFLSFSLPNSANSSPRLSSSFLKKYKTESPSQASPLQHEISNARQPNTEEKHEHPILPLEFYLRRSKSCREGRSYALSYDFDLWVDKPDFSAQLDNKKHFNSFCKADHMNTKVNHHNHNKKSSNNHRYGMDMSSDDGFKCGALCLFLPGFGKAKTIRSSRKEELEVGNVISRTVSLEKFECGSWASSAIGDGDSMNQYFDLPMELIRSGANDANSPVSTAFLFDKDIKGVLKNGSSRSMAQSAARKSHESARHVRFSTASPQSYPASPASCITPRLRQAREDFNAFLEAQSA